MLMFALFVAAVCLQQSAGRSLENVLEDKSLILAEAVLSPGSEWILNDEEFKDAKREKRSVGLRARRAAANLGAMFDAMDEDHDGVLLAVDFDTHFKLFDHDKNGHVTENEYIVGFIFGDRSLARRLFRHGDFNGNGYLDIRDARVIRNRFDHDHDGKVTRGEYIAKWQQMLADINA